MRALPPLLRPAWLALALALLVPSACRPVVSDDDDAGDDDTGDDDAGDDDTVDPNAPAVTIASPSDGAVLNTPAAVSLQGSAVDDQDGPITGDALAWRSDVDGALGAGGSLVVSLSLGPHTLTLETTDSDGNDGSDSVSVTVTDVNAAPQAFIDQPTDGASFVEGDTIAFAGHADDAEDGSLSGGSLFWTSTLDGSLGTGATATLTGASLGTHTVLLTVVDSQGAQGIASIEVDVVAVGQNRVPVTTILAPGDGSAFTEGADVTLEGASEDPADGTLSAGDLQWTSSRDGSLGSGSTLVQSGLSLGIHTITLTGTDSENASSTDTISIAVNAVGNDPPSVSISSPATGSTVTAGSNVLLQGAATDPEDGALSGADLEWASSRDGALGTGSPLSTSALSVGNHSITLTATDSGGALGIASVSLHVLTANTAPSVSITAPADNSTYTAGDTIAFSATATDPEDGPLSGSSVVWQSNLFGTMGTGTSLSFGSLGAGLHQITFTAVDSGGLPGSDSVTITVNPSAVNLPPVAQLTGPSLVNVGEPVTFDASASSDPDGSIVDYTFDFGDGSPEQTGGSASATHTFAAEGSWTVSVTVTDDDGATGQVDLLVDSIIPEPVPEVVHDTDEAFGTMCRMALDGSDNPHVIYRNNTHGALQYAAFDGSGWDLDLVDGLGFDVGGLVDGDADILVDPSGQVHIVYLLADGELWYATPAASGWIREHIDDAYTPSVSSGQISVAWDPLNQRPTVAFTHYDAFNNDYYPVLAYRTGANAWTESPYAIATWGNWTTGGLVFTASGVAWMTFEPEDARVVNWSAASGFFGEEVMTPSFGYADGMPVILDASNQPVVMTDEGLFHRVGGSWQPSDFEISDTSYYALGANAGDFWLAHRHGSDIELIHGDPYWDYQYQGPMDSAWPDVAVDSTGKPWACFFRSNNLMVY